MTTPSSLPQPLTQAGVASAEDGFVILDGPDGVAITLTSEAAEETGHNLIAAAAQANQQKADGPA